MTKIILSWFYATLIVSQITFANEDEKPYVIGKLISQLGNNLFQVAAASAVAWGDH